MKQVEECKLSMEHQVVKVLFHIVSVLDVFEVNHIELQVADFEPLGVVQKYFLEDKLKFPEEAYKMFEVEVEEMLHIVVDIHIVVDKDIDIG